MIKKTNTFIKSGRKENCLDLIKKNLYELQQSVMFNGEMLKSFILQSVIRVSLQHYIGGPSNTNVMG